MLDHLNIHVGVLVCWHQLCRLLVAWLHEQDLPLGQPGLEQAEELPDGTLRIYVRVPESPLSLRGQITQKEGDLSYLASWEQAGPEGGELSLLVPPGLWAWQKEVLQ
jgi:hypothetical protein